MDVHLNETVITAADSAQVNTESFSEPVSTLEDLSHFIDLKIDSLNKEREQCEKRIEELKKKRIALKAPGPIDILMKMFLSLATLEATNATMVEDLEKEKRQRETAEKEVDAMSFIFSNAVVRSKGEVFIYKLRHHFGPIMDIHSNNGYCIWTEANKQLTGFKIQDSQFLNAFHTMLNTTNILDPSMRHLEIKIGYTSTAANSFKQMLIQTTNELRKSNFSSQSEVIHQAGKNKDLDDIKKCANIVFANLAAKPPAYMIPFFELVDKIEKEI
jgi:hypothetical protein